MNENEKITITKAEAAMLTPRTDAMQKAMAKLAEHVINEVVPLGCRPDAAWAVMLRASIGHCLALSWTCQAERYGMQNETPSMDDKMELVDVVANIVVREVGKLLARQLKRKAEGN